MTDITPASIELTITDRTYWMLNIIRSMGGRTVISDETDWIAAFCDDHEGEVSDTFNRAIKSGYLAVSHDCDQDASTARLTPAGEAAIQEFDKGTAPSAHFPAGPTAFFPLIAELEAANEQLAATRSPATYRRMVDQDEANDALERLDAARRSARAFLSSVPPTRYVTFWRKPDASLDWDFHISETQEQLAQCEQNLKRQNVIQYSTYPLGLQVEEHSATFGRPWTDAEKKRA